MSSHKLIAAAALVLLGPAAWTAPQAQHGRCEVRGFLLEQAPAYSPSGGPFSFAISLDPNITPGQAAVILEAASNWLDLLELQSPGHLVSPFPLTFVNGPLGGNTLAQALTSWDSSGVLQFSTIMIDNDGSSIFFVDPTPGNDSEFDSTGACITGACAGVSDLLTVMRHEIGHAIGWTGFYNAGMPNPHVGPLISGATFDPGRFNVPLDPALTSHANASVFPGDLMAPGLAAGQRISASPYPDLTVLARGYQHWVGLRFLDSNAPGGSNGSADFPYILFDQAQSLAPSGMPLVVVPGVYDEFNPMVFDTEHRFILSRGGSAVID